MRTQTAAFAIPRKAQHFPAVRPQTAALRLWLLALICLSPPFSGLARGSPAVEAPTRPDRIPLFEQTGGPRLAGPSILHPVRLKSGTFAGAGSLEANWAAAQAAAPGATAVHVLVQLDRAPDAEDRARLEAAGVHLLGYVPEGSYFARVRRGADLARAAAAGLRWLGTVYPEDKLSDTLLAGTPGVWAVEGDGSLNLVVYAFEDVPEADARAALTRVGCQVRRVILELHCWEVRLPAAGLLELAGLNWVRWIEEVPPPITLHNDGLRTNVQAYVLADPPYGLSGTGVVVGIWDGGWVDFAHPDFAGRAFPGETSVPEQRHPHATHVAGTLGGSGAASAQAGGFPGQWRGVAPGVTLISYDVSNAFLVEEHRDARERHGAVISHNSWGVTVSEFFGNCHLLGDYTGDAATFDHLVTGLLGAPYHVVFAIGNARGRQDSSGCREPGGYGTVGVPATAKNVLSVGAIHSDDNSMTVFSGWGPTDDGRLKPEVVAPGDEVSGDGGITSAQPNGGYGVLVGTSMAAPAVSGAAAVLIEDYRRLFNGLTPQPALIKGLLTHTAADLDDETDWFQPGPDYASGYGRIQIRNAVDHLRGGGWLAGKVAPGQTVSYFLPVPPETAQVKVTLVWDDVPALQNAAHTLVNDLDLVVTDPAGNRHFPWTLDPANPSAPATRTQPDRVNIIEQVLADGNVLPGIWTLTVSGAHLPLGMGQKFALLFSPATLPPIPWLSLEPQAPLDSAAGNGDGFLDPGEEIEERLVLRHRDGPGATNITARVQTDSPWVHWLRADAEYPDLAPGLAVTNPAPFAYRVSKQAPCGAVLRFEHVITLAGGVRLTNYFQRVVGRLEVTNVAEAVFAAADTPLPIPDLGVCLSTLPVTVTGQVLEARVAVRLDHTWLDDLELRLLAPDGGSVVLVPPLRFFGDNLGRGDCGSEVEWTVFDDAATQTMAEGSSPYVGSFRPFEPLAGLHGRPLEGDWQLLITDTSAEDSGTLLCWELALRYAQSGYRCEFFNRLPVAPDAALSVWFERPLRLNLPGYDPDEDPLSFRLLDPPAHGSLEEFDPATGAVTYTPAPGYSGPDAFTYEVGDGHAVSGPATVRLTVHPPSVDLAVSPRVIPAPPRHDLPFQVIITVTNRGPNPATEVALTGVLPDGLELLEVTATQGVVLVEDMNLQAAVGELAEGASADVSLTLRAAAPGNFQIALSVEAAEIEIAPEDNSVDFEWTVRPTANLALNGAVSANPTPLGQPLDVAWRVTNSGPHPAPDVRLTALLPPETELVSVHTGENAEWTFTDGRFEARWPELAVDAGVEMSWTLTPGQTGQLELSAAVAAAEPDPDPADNETAAHVEVRPVTDLQLTWQPPSGPVAQETPFAQTLRILNRSDVRATAVEVRLAPAPELEILTATPTAGTATRDDPGLLWTLDHLAPGGELALDLELRAAQVGWFTNQAVATAFEFDAEPSDNVAETGVEVRPAADLLMAIEPPVGRLLLGLPATYRLLVTNLGSASATQVTVEHPLPDGFELVDVQSSQGTVTNEAGVIRAVLGDVEVDAVAAVTLEIEPTLAGPVRVQATASAFEVDPVPKNNSAEAIFPVELLADLAVSLEPESDSVLLTRETRLRVLAVNHGPFDAAGVRAVLALPEAFAVEQIETSVGEVTATPEGWGFHFGDLPAGAAATGEVRIAALQAGVWTNQISAVADTPDPEPANDRSESVVEVLPAVDLAVEHLPPDGPVVVFHPFPLDLLITNRGPLEATGVRVAVELPEGFAVVDVSSPGIHCSMRNRRVVCELGALPASAEARLTLTLLPVASGPFNTIASVAADQAELAPDDNEHTLSGWVEEDADLAVTCQINPGQPAVGQAIFLDVEAENRGPFAASNVVVRLALPEPGQLRAVEPASLTWTPTTEGAMVNLGDLPPAERTPLRFELAATASGPFAPRVEIFAPQPDLAPANNHCEALVQVLPTANLALFLQAVPDKVPPGVPWELTLTLTNRGPEAASDVTVTGEIPAGLELIEATAASGDWEVGPTAWEWRLETLPAGTETTLLMRWWADALGEFVQAATATALEADSDLDDNSAAVPVRVQPEADLVLEGLPPAQPLVRDTATRYGFAVENRGPTPATTVRLTHSLPDLFQPDALAVSAGDAVLTNGLIIWQLPELAVGTRAELTLDVTLFASGLVTNRAEVDAFEADLTPANNRVAEVLQVSDLADLALTATVEPDRPLQGREFVLRLTLTNHGPHRAGDIELTLHLPAGVELQDWETPSEGELETSEGEVMARLVALESSETVEWVLRLRSLEPGMLRFPVRARSAALDPEPANNSREAETEVLPTADLQLTKHALDEPVLRDLPLQYLLVVSNAGPNAATGVRVREWLPPQTTLLAVEFSDGDYELNDGELTYLPGDLEAGDRAELRLTLRPEATGWLTNVALAEMDQPDYHPENNTALTVNEVLLGADLALTLAGPESPTLIGQPLEYALTVTNRGPHPATHLQLHVQLPPYVRVEALRPQSATHERTNGLLVIALEDLPATSATGCSLTLVSETEGLLAVSAEALAAEWDPDREDNRAAAATELRRGADLAVQLLTDAEELPTGQEWNLLLVVTNRGPHAATGIRVTNWLPEGTELVRLEPSAGAWAPDAGGFIAELETLEPGGLVCAEFTLRRNTPGWITNRAEISAGTYDPAPADNHAALTARVHPAATLLVEHGPAPVALLLSNQYVITVVVTNRGEVPAPRTHMLVAFSLNVDLLDADFVGGNAELAPPGVVCYLGDFPPGGSAVLHVLARPTAPGLFVSQAGLISVGVPRPSPGTLSRLEIPVYDRPYLFSERVGNRLILSWPALAADYDLEFCDDLSLGQWEPLLNPKIIVGNEVTVNVKLSSPARYYRLRKIEP